MPGRSVLLSHAIYPRAALETAQLAFAQLCKVDVKAEGRDLRVDIVQVNGAPPETLDEFLSYVLSAAMEHHLAVIEP